MQDEHSAPNSRQSTRDPRLEQELLEARALISRLQLFIDNTPAALAMFDREMRYLYVNARWRKDYRLGDCELHGRSHYDIFPEIPPEWREFHRRGLAGEELRAEEDRFVRVDGTVQWLHWEIKPWFDVAGRVGGIVIFSEDITARHQAEEARRRALLFTETLLDQSPVAIRVFDGVSGDCVRANRVAAELTGGTIRQMLGQNFRQLASWRSAGLIGIAEAVLSDGEPRQVEIEMTSSFGRQLTARFFLSRCMVEERPQLLVIGQDISEEKNLAEQKQRIEEQMLHTQKLESLGVLAGGIAHDFNNILMTVIGNADLALLRLPAESPAVGYLQQIQLAASKATDLAGQMLAYSGRGTFVVQSLNLNRVIQEMTHMLEVSISKKAQLRFNLAQHLPAVEVDPTQLRQVIMNLVINAAEALGDDSGMIAVATGAVECDAVELRETWFKNDLPAGLYVYLEVVDSGCGMDQETVRRIFDPFFSTKFSGRGLGLAAVLGIIRGHRGTIEVHSEPGRGTTFKILLPASRRPEVSSDSAPSDKAWRGDGLVLLVDDEETVREVGRTMLEELGFEVMTANDGHEALDLFRARRKEIRLVIMDLTMPHVSGEEAFRQIRRLDPDVRVIITSGYHEQEVVQRFTGKGRVDFLQKPFRLADLQKMLQSRDARRD